MCSPSIHSWRTALTHEGPRTFTSGRSFATYLYLGVSTSPTMRCVTSDVRSSLCTAPICSAREANSDCNGGQYDNTVTTIGSLTRVSGGIEVQHSTTPRSGCDDAPVPVSAGLQM